jgi:hypothetical protein
VLKETRSTIHATFTGVTDGHGNGPRIVFTKLARRPDGRERYITASAAIPAEDLDRLRGELRISDRAKLTVLTDWGKPGIPVTLLLFSKVEEDEPVSP